MEKSIVKPNDDQKPEDGNGVDVTLIDKMLDLSPRQRIDAFVRHMRFIRKLQNARTAS